MLFSIYSKIGRRMKFVRFEFTVPRDMRGRIDDVVLKALKNDVIDVLGEVLGVGRLASVLIMRIVIFMWTGIILWFRLTRLLGRATRLGFSLGVT